MATNSCLCFGHRKLKPDPLGFSQGEVVLFLFYGQSPALHTLGSVNRRLPFFLKGYFFPEFWEAAVLFIRCPSS